MGWEIMGVPQRWTPLSEKEIEARNRPPSPRRFCAMRKQCLRRGSKTGGCDCLYEYGQCKLNDVIQQWKLDNEEP